MNRQDRVQRLKRIIILTLIVAILIPTVLCIYLLIKVHTLEQEMEELYQTRIEYLKGEAQTAAAGNLQTGADEILSISEGTLSIADSDKVTISQDNISVSDNESASEYKVYLTFDDGPSVMTEEILDILKQYNVKATFFVVGKTEENLLPMYRRIVEEGHTIGMHSYSHQYRNIYKSLESFETDLDKIRELIYNETGVWSEYYRFPGGSSNDISRNDIEAYIECLQDKDIQYYDWNVSSGDATSTSLSSDKIEDNVMESFGRYHTSVVLLHDTGNRRTTVEALPGIIEAYQELGAELLPIDENTTLVQHIQIYK